MRNDYIRKLNYRAYIYTEKHPLKIPPMKLKGYALAFTSAAAYGLIPLFILFLKQDNFPLNTTLVYRFGLSALMILGYLVYKKEKLRVSLRELSLLIILGVLFAFSAEFLFIAYDFLTPGVASTILFVYPVIIASIMAIFFNERISKNMIISLFISLGGVAILSMKGSSFAINLPGLLIALASALSYSLYIVLVNKGRFSISGLTLTFYSLLFSCSFYLIKAIVVQDSLAIPNVSTFFTVLLFGFITSVVSLTTLVFAIEIIGSTMTSILGAVEPVVAVAVSVYLFGEQMTTNLLAGIVMIISGVTLSILADARKRKKQIKKRHKIAVQKLTEAQMKVTDQEKIQAPK